MQMGKHTFSVQLLHHLLMLQLKTKRKKELWWTFSGKPIRYAIEDFALVTGLNCEPGNQTALVAGNRKEKRKRVSENENEGEIWRSLFSEAENPTPKLIGRKLEDREYRDPLKVFRLALILLIEGILCPTSDATPVRREIVEMVGDVEKFMQHPWGRESFQFTVKRVKKKLVPYHYVAESSVAVQGFAHAMVLVTVCSCPAILGHQLSPEDTLQSVLGKKFVIDVDAAKTLDKGGQAKVKALLVEDQWEDSLRFKDKPDLSVDYMLASIAEDYPFEPHTWTGGVTVEEALQSPPPPKGAMDAESSASDAESSGNADRIDETMIDESLDDVSDPVRGVENLNDPVRGVEDLNDPVRGLEDSTDPVRGLDADEPVRRRQKTNKNFEETFEKELKELKDQIRDQNDEMRDIRDEIRDQMRDQMRDQNEEMRDKIRDEIRDQMRDQNEEMRNKIRDEIRDQMRELREEIIKDLKGRYGDNETENWSIQPDMETGAASNLDPLQDAAVPLPPTETLNESLEKEVKELKDRIKEQNDKIRDQEEEIRELKKQTKKRKFDGGSGDREAPATSLVDPWGKSTVDGLIEKIKPQLEKYHVRQMENHDISHDSTIEGREIIHRVNFA
ncbi:unnamed protein product [Microthlaspi erraticum]|uniref:DUF1985 domain-containing protein n=1 Tax=Microthlaspi erraticum TaxID=1685480 RepID=A0A6D2I4U9_9BRAS|nr:unnamed protein product [Microthlaspi erraticum]